MDRDRRGTCRRSRGRRLQCRCRREPALGAARLKGSRRLRSSSAAAARARRLARRPVPDRSKRTPQLWPRWFRPGGWRPRLRRRAWMRECKGRQPWWNIEFMPLRAVSTAAESLPWPSSMPLRVRAKSAASGGRGCAGSGARLDLGADWQGFRHRMVLGLGVQMRVPASMVPRIVVRGQTAGNEGKRTRIREQGTRIRNLRRLRWGIHCWIRLSLRILEIRATIRPVFCGPAIQIERRAMDTPDAFLGRPDQPTDDELMEVLGPAALLWSELIQEVTADAGKVTEEWQGILREEVRVVSAAEAEGPQHHLSGAVQRLLPGGIHPEREGGECGKGGAPAKEGGRSAGDSAALSRGHGPAPDGLQRKRPHGHSQAGQIKMAS